MAPRSSRNSKATRKSQKSQSKAKPCAENQTRKVKTESIQYSVMKRTRQYNGSNVESSESEDQYDTDDYEPEEHTRTLKKPTVDEGMTSKISTDHKISILQTCCQHKDQYLSTPRGQELGFYQYIFKILSKSIRAQYCQGAKHLQRDIDNWVASRRRAFVNSHRAEVPLGKPQNALDDWIDNWNKCFSARRCRVDAPHIEQGLWPSMKDDILQKLDQIVLQPIRTALDQLDKKANNSLTEPGKRSRSLGASIRGNIRNLDQLLDDAKLRLGDSFTSEARSRLKALTAKHRIGRGQTEGSDPGSDLGHRSDPGYWSESRTGPESDPENGWDEAHSPMGINQEDADEGGFGTRNHYNGGDDGIQDDVPVWLSPNVSEPESPERPRTRRSGATNEKNTIRVGAGTPSSSSRRNGVHGRRQQAGDSPQALNKGKGKARIPYSHQESSTETRSRSEQTPAAPSSGKRKRKPHPNRSPSVAGPNNKRDQRENCGTTASRVGGNTALMSGGRYGFPNGQLVTPPETGSRNHVKPRTTREETIIDLTLESDTPSDCEEVEVSPPQSKRRRGGTRRSDAGPALQISSPSTRREGRRRFGRGNPQRIPHGSGF